MTEPNTSCAAFQHSAAIDPDAVAVRSIGGEQTLTWRVYAEEVPAVAAGPAALGAGRAGRRAPHHLGRGAACGRN
ncbi:hypothetical protein [Nocardia sp. NPDC004260]